MSVIFIDIRPILFCANLEESFGEVCVSCDKCGRARRAREKRLEEEEKKHERNT